jgi:hypothetical protein
VATIQQIMDDVVAETRRPDLTTRIERAVKNALLRIHQSELFAADLFEGRIGSTAYTSVAPDSRFVIPLDGHDSLPACSTSFTITTLPTPSSAKSTASKTTPTSSSTRWEQYASASLAAQAARSLCLQETRSARLAASTDRIIAIRI